MLDGQWQVGPEQLSAGLSQVDYGIAPFPPLSTGSQAEVTTLVQGPVVVIPSSAVDKESAALLLAWMSSPEKLAEAAFVNSMLPSSYTAATDSKFQQIPYFEMFLELISQPSSGRLSPLQTSTEIGEMHKTN